MIHQFIFAGPKPGLSALAFHSYWINFHAVEYASKIIQIKRYLVATRHPLEVSGELPFFEGVAEIWLANETEQLASLQSSEFLLGARIDEPRWAAFWRTLVVDTEPETFIDTLQEGQPLPEYVKLYVLLKRKSGADLDAFKHILRENHSDMAAIQPALKRSMIGFARQGLYTLGEPLFDAVETWSFEDTLEDRKALVRLQEDRFRQPAEEWLDIRHAYFFIGCEHWIIRPGEREAD